MNLLYEQCMPRLGWALVHFIWQGAAVGLLAVGLLLLLRRASAQARYVAACAALAAMLAAPVVTAMLVDVPAPAPAAALHEVDDEPAGGTAPLPPLSPRTQDRTALARAVAANVSGPPPLAEPPEPSWTTAVGLAASALESHFPPIVGLWTLGVAAMSLWYAAGWLRLRRLVRRETRPLAARWAALAEDISRRLGLRRAVRLAESAAAGVPTVIGWLKPVVVLPASVLTGLPADQVEALLAHELAHVRRWDDVVNLFQTLAEAVLFYHPAVWWLSGRLRTEREQCCDDVVLAVCGDRMAYARALATLGESQQAARPALAARGGRLLARIQRILSAEPSPRTRAWWLAGAVAFAATAVVLLGSLALAPEGMASDAGVTREVSALSAAERERLEELLPRMHLEKDWKPAAEELIEMGPAVAPHLLPRLDRGGTDTPAIHVLKALAEAPSVQDLMLEVLDKPPYKTINRRYAATLVLGASQNPAHGRRLVAALEQAVALDPKVAGGELGPVFALSQLGGDAGLEGLVRALHIISPDKTWLVAKHLAETDRADALPVLRKTLARINVRHQDRTFNHVAHAIRGLEERTGQSWSRIEPLYAPVVRAAKRRNATAADAAGARFSPAVEKHFQDMGPHIWVYAYDLDTGQALERSVAPKGPPSVDAWMRTMGADLRIEANDDAITLVAVDLHLAPLEPKDWTALRPAALAEAVGGKAPDGPSARRHTIRRALNVPYAFRTREGGIGMFRSTRWIDKAPGMGVELKILERPAPAVAATP
jgi:beta-lactamase regulating signal transducer with metallopeptidase domain